MTDLKAKAQSLSEKFNTTGANWIANAPDAKRMAIFAAIGFPVALVAFPVGLAILAFPTIQMGAGYGLVGASKALDAFSKPAVTPPAPPAPPAQK